VMRNRIKVLIVDDSALMRKTLKEILLTDDALDVVGTARDGQDAIDKVKELKPDVITMDINMPIMDGLTSMQHILNDYPDIPIIIISSLSTEGALTTFEALALGAFDYVAKPSGTVSSDIHVVGRDIITKVKLAHKSARRKSPANKAGSIRKPLAPSAASASSDVPTTKRARSDELSAVVVIGVSTGGPGTLMDVLPLLPADLNAAVLVVQHMPPSFTSSFAKRIGQACSISFKEAEAGDVLANGRGYLAPGGYQLLVHRDGRMLRLSSRPLTQFMPSVNVTMESVLERLGGRKMVGVIMTGMGDDGADAMVKIRQAGGITIAEEERGKRVEAAATQGIIGELSSRKLDARNRIYISVVFSQEAPMVQALLFMIFYNIKEIGSLSYSSITDEDIYGAEENRSISSCEMILDTDLEAAELYSFFDIMYVDRVAIVDLSDSRLTAQSSSRDKASFRFYELFFEEFRKLHPLLFVYPNASGVELSRLIRIQAALIEHEANLIPDHPVVQEIRRFYELSQFLIARRTKLSPELADMLRREYGRLFETVYGYVRGRFLYKTLKAREGELVKQLSDMVEKMDRTLIRKLMIHVSGLRTLDEHALTYLIQLRRDLQERGISIAIIAGDPLNRRMVNIFDSIRTIESFAVFATEREAVLSDS